MNPKLQTAALIAAGIALVTAIIVLRAAPAPSPATAQQTATTPHPATKAPANDGDANVSLWDPGSSADEATDFVALCDDATLSSHERMVHFLSRLKEWSEQSHPYQGDDGYSAMLAQYETITDTSQEAMRERSKLLLELGRHQLRLGLTDEAILSFSQLRQIAREDELGQPDLAVTASYHLGLAHLRKGETVNCVFHRTGESCILPIREGGLHMDPAPSRSAIECFKEVLAQKPADVVARWLLNIALMTVREPKPEVPAEYLLPPDIFTSKIEFPHFPNIASRLGLDVMSYAGGAVVEDLNNDNLLDIMVSSWGTGDAILYFENSGNGQFVEKSQEAGLAGITGGLNMVQTDYDNDGWIDILVLRGAWLSAKGRHPNSLLRNLGGGKFRDVTFDAGLGKVHYPTQNASWSDYDLDGDLDLFIGNEGYPAQLFNNAGDGTFTDLAVQAGISPKNSAGNPVWTKGSSWGDFNNDRLPDLYLSNLGAANCLYRNNGDGSFVDVAIAAGVQNPMNGFPTWFWDVNNDGFLDIFASSYGSTVEHVALGYLGLPQKSPDDLLYLGNGKGVFREVTGEYNIGAPSAPMGSNFGDLNNDGFSDFYLGTGYPGYEALVPNLMFLNQNGQRFEDVTFAGGFGHLQKGHGVAFADIDNDGDQDIFEETGGAYKGDAFANALFENPGFGNHWINIKLTGTQSNRAAIGTHLRIDITEAGRSRSIHAWVNSGGSFGANPLRREIGLGQAERVDLIEIFWPASGTTQRFENVPLDVFIAINEDAPDLEILHVRPFMW